MTLLTQAVSESEPGSADEQTQCGSAFPALVAAIGFVFTFSAFYPGVLSSDSLDQFQQASNFHFSDWQPPIMAILWSVLTRIWAGPQLMLLTQEALFWGGVYLLLGALDIRAVWARVILVLLLFSPVLLNFSGVIWKDIQLAAAWIFVLAAVFSAQMRGMQLSRLQKAGLLALIVYGGLVRINAGLVAGPLVLYVLTGCPRLASLWRTLAVYLCIALGCLGLGQGVKWAFPVDRSAVTDALLTFDLAALSTAKGENLFPFPLSDTELQAVKTCYGDAAIVDPFIWGDCGFLWKDVSALREQNKRALWRAWRKAVLHAPHLYLAARLKHYGAFLSVTRSPPDIWMPGSSPNSFGFPTKIEGVYQLLGAYVNVFGGSEICRPVFWLALALLIQLSLLVAEKASVTGRMINAAGLTAVLYLLTFLPFGMAPDFRYAYVSIAMTTFGLCALVAAVERRMRPDGSAPDYSFRRIFLED